MVVLTGVVLTSVILVESVRPRSVLTGIIMEIVPSGFVSDGRLLIVTVVGRIVRVWRVILHHLQFVVQILMGME